MGTQETKDVAAALEQSGDLSGGKGDSQNVVALGQLGIKRSACGEQAD